MLVRFTHPMRLVVALVVFVSGVSWADDEPQKIDPNKSAASDDGNAKQPELRKKDEQPKEPSLLDKLQKELFKELEDDPTGKPKAQPQPKEDKFDRAAKGMRSAGNKLDEQHTGEETRKIQEQVIRDLDDLIKQLQNPPPNGGGGGGGGRSSNSGGSSSSASGGGSSRQQRNAALGQQGKPQGGQSQSQGNDSEGASGGQDRKNAQGSSERTDGERKKAEEAARKQKLEMDVWGHLPPHLREQLLNTYGERMLPKYEQLVKQFYEALSEQTEATPRR